MLSIGTVEEGEEVLDSARLSDSDSDSDNGPLHDGHNGENGFESPRLDSPTDSDDDDVEEDVVGQNDETFAPDEQDLHPLGTGHRVQLTEHDRAYSSGIDSDLATTPRVDSVL